MAKSKGPKKTSDKIRKKALKQLRKTQDKINAEHPDLLDSVREKIKPPTRDDAVEDELIINREKNVRAVMQLMAIAPQSKTFKTKLKKILMDAKQGTLH